MTEPIDLPHPTFCVPGTVGPPGERVFYLQAAQDDRLVTLRLEKQQVAALATYLAELLSDLPAPDGPRPEQTELVEPILAEWVVGTIGVAYRSEADRIVVALEELRVEADDEPGAGMIDDPSEPGRAQVHLTREQAAHLVSLGAELVATGRPPCPLCGQPVDAQGHACVKSNGHGHR